MTSEELKLMIRDRHPPARYMTSAEMQRLIALLMELRELTQSRCTHALAGELVRAALCGEPFGEIWHRAGASDKPGES